MMMIRFCIFRPSTGTTMWIEREPFSEGIFAAEAWMKLHYPGWLMYGWPENVAGEELENV